MDGWLAILEFNIWLHPQVERGAVKTKKHMCIPSTYLDIPLPPGQSSIMITSFSNGLKYIL